jgi:O-antigen biosynthesis protein
MNLTPPCVQVQPGTQPSHSFYVKGKFLYAGEEKYFIKGVTYGTFAPQPDGTQFPRPEAVEKDFRMMQHYGINSVRTYTIPPTYLLDIALKYDLKVMVGLLWQEQYTTFLEDAHHKNDILKRVKGDVLSCQQHPAILCYTIGNEIPASIVRWYGKTKVENFLKQLYNTVKQADADSLVTYVNYPTTEYLDLSFLDFNCFNVYLETPEKLGAYIARLHNLTGDRPLVLAEIGLDSVRNGRKQQARVLKWQIETIFEKGCAGMFVFAWTDEWWCGGFDIENWDFGIVDRQRAPKPALDVVSKTMQEVPFKNSKSLPFISVVVCSYNGSTTIRDTMEGLQKLDYPQYEVIVVNDGSTDNLVGIVQEYPVKLINTPNRGLSSARNTGLYKAKGEIVAYIDDDAYPDPHWLHYLAYAYLHSNHAGMGGPNLIPGEDGLIAKCVANAPGGPVHVLVSDELAEHMPGCNMSFKRSVLLEMGGFDPIYCIAGDDVDVCWRVQKAGYTIGYHPSAVVWHHRRNSLKAYWKQQKGYGRAEALLEAKWPEKYNGLGHLSWSGRLYGNGYTLPLPFKKEKIFYGKWGSALFQSIYQPANSFLPCFLLMPEMYLTTLILALIASLGILWPPLLWIWLLFGISLLVVITQAVISAFRNASLSFCRHERFKYRMIIIFLHLLQPLARLWGRLKNGLTPWRNRVVTARIFEFSFGFRVLTYWSEEWHSAEEWLIHIEKELISHKIRVIRGGEFDKWDLQAATGLFARTRALLAIEEHGSGKQFLKLKTWPWPGLRGLLTVGCFFLIAVWAATDEAFIITLVFACIGLTMVIEYMKSESSVVYCFKKVFNNLKPVEKIRVVDEKLAEGREAAKTNEQIENPVFALVSEETLKLQALQNQKQ